MRLGHLQRNVTEPAGTDPVRIVITCAESDKEWRSGREIEFAAETQVQVRLQQARRLANRTAFFLEGRCVEIDDTEELFTGSVTDPRTRDYVLGRFG